MTLLDYVKASLKIKTVDNNIDTYIETLIDSAKADLTNTSDVNKNVDFADPLIMQAVAMYVGYNWTVNTERSDHYKKLYDDLKGKLAVSSDYTEY